MTIDVTGTWEGLKDALEEMTGDHPDKPESKPPISMDEFWTRWLFVCLLLAAYKLYPDERDEFVGAPGTEPRDTWDGMEDPTVADGYAAIDW